MPELPEVEITARLIGEAVAGVEVESIATPGLNVLRSFKPPVQDLEGHRLLGVRRRGKLFIVDSDAGLSVIVHLMAAGRLQLWDDRAALTDRRSRLLVRLADGRELRLREFGTKQRAWVRVVPTADLDEDETLAALGPEAWPDPPDLKQLLATARPLYSELRDQRVIAGIGRSWVDEILWSARLSPFKRGADLTTEESDRLRKAIIERLGGAIQAYEKELSLPLPDKLPLPLLVHRHEGEPCPSCGTTIEAVHYQDYVMCYCPQEQTGGTVLKDRRLSRLLK